MIDCRNQHVFHCLLLSSCICSWQSRYLSWKNGWYILWLKIHFVLLADFFRALKLQCTSFELCIGLRFKDFLLRFIEVDVFSGLDLLFLISIYLCFVNILTQFWILKFILLRWLYWSCWFKKWLWLVVNGFEIHCSVI